MASKILLVEDSEESKDLVLKALGSTFEVKWGTTLREASQFLKEDHYDLVLLDVELPDGDGFHFYSMLKSEDLHKGLPVIFLTVRDSVSDRIMGITMGADDYIMKPFVPQELKARVEMRIRKNADMSHFGKTIRKGNLEVNLAEQRTYLIEQDKKRDLGLTTLEFKILTFLVNHAEHVFSRDDLLNQVWGQETYLTDRSVDTHIYSLRKKLGAFSNLIQSVYGQGYRFSLCEAVPSQTKGQAA